MTLFHPHAFYTEEEDMFLHPYMADANCIENITFSVVFVIACYQ